MGGAALHFGWVAEMKTGEGKTLVSTLPAYLNGARPARACTSSPSTTTSPAVDAEWMGRIHKWLGLNVGLIIPGFKDRPDEKRRNYAGRHHVRHQQRDRLRLPARQHGAAARRQGAARPQLLHRRRGRLDPHRRGAHAAHHLRSCRRRRQALLPLRLDRPLARARRRLRGRGGQAGRRAARGRHRARSRRRSASRTSTTTCSPTSCTSSRSR